MGPPLSSFHLNLVLIFLEYFLRLVWILELAESEMTPNNCYFKKKVVCFSNKYKVKQLHNCQSSVSLLHYLNTWLHSHSPICLLQFHL